MTDIQWQLHRLICSRANSHLKCMAFKYCDIPGSIYLIYLHPTFFFFFFFFFELTSFLPSIIPSLPLPSPQTLLSSCRVGRRALMTSLTLFLCSSPKTQIKVRLKGSRDEHSPTEAPTMSHKEWFSPQIQLPWLFPVIADVKKLVFVMLRLSQ